MPKKTFLIAITAIFCLGVMFIAYLLIEQKIASREEELSKEPAQLEAVELVDRACENCFSMSYLLDVLQQEDVIFKRIKQVDINSEEGKALKDKYSVNKLPIMFITGEIAKNQDFLDLFKGFGEIKDDVLISDVYPPYRDLKTDEIVGLVDLTIIYDQACAECHATKKHLEFLRAEGIEPATEKKLDVSTEEARQLIAKYNITKVPTIILSPAAKNYKIFTEHWQEVGRVADDGYYIYTAPEKIGTYKDLAKNEIIKVQVNN